MLKNVISRGKDNWTEFNVFLYYDTLNHAFCDRSGRDCDLKISPPNAEQQFIRGSLIKFPDFFRMGTFIDSTHMKLYSPLK